LPLSFLRSFPGFIPSFYLPYSGAQIFRTAKIPLPAATFFVFIPAATRAGLVASYLLFNRYGLRRMEQSFHVRRILGFVRFQFNGVFPPFFFENGGDLIHSFFGPDTNPHGIPFSPQFSRPVPLNAFIPRPPVIWFPNFFIAVVYFSHGFLFSFGCSPFFEGWPTNGVD
jgi:hypothetical protein